MGRILVILAGLCAVAHAQSRNSFGQNSRFAKPIAVAEQNSFVDQDRQSQYQQNQYQENQYQENQYSQNQQAAPRPSAGSCQSNERAPVSGSCDRYIECVNGTMEEKLCPDGLLFNPNAKGYPCQYPNEVQCLERSSLQPAQPTADCPHQFGFYKLGDARNCSGFRNCVNGVGYDLVCSEGLAFSSETYRCEWPDEVADCDAEAFLGFRCPEVPELKGFGPPEGFRLYRADYDCQKYFVCIGNRPRALNCGGANAFDELTSSCVSADEVSACPAELRDLAARSRDVETQRLAKQLEVDNLPQQLKRRQF